MRAAIVDSFDRPPHFGPVDAPVPHGPHEVLVDVVAAGLHPRVRSGADGSHYTETGTFPFVPGVDGVGRRPDGNLVYFVSVDSAPGSMAEQTVIDPRRSVPLPEGLDPVIAAAAMNPAMSSWVAIQQRIRFQPGQSVLVLGATGNAGQMAVQISKLLGAGLVVGAGRNQEQLDTLGSFGADRVVSLAGDPGEVARRVADAACEVDVVIDYLWGKPAEAAMPAMVRKRSDRSRALTWIQIGAVAGPDVAVPSQILRSANFTLIGSGQGSVTTAGYLAAFPALLDVLAGGELAVNATPVPLSDVETAWSAPTRPGERVVFVPGTSDRVGR